MRWQIVVWYCISRTASWVQRFSVKSSRWRNMSGHWLNMGVIAAVGGPSSKIRPASENENIAVQISLAQSRKQKGRAFWYCCVWPYIIGHLAERTWLMEKLLYSKVRFIFHWSCFYWYLRDFTGWKLGKLNFSGARCEVSNINILCSYALLGNFIHRFSDQL